MASDEIAKANQIILKQSQELLSQKKTISWRTEVALQQEKAINEKEKLLSMREEELRQTHLTIQQLREEIPQQLQSMRHFAQALEEKYTNRKMHYYHTNLPKLFINTCIIYPLEILTLKEHLAGKENSSRRANRK